MRLVLGSAVWLHILTSHAVLYVPQTEWKQHPLPVREIHQWPLLTWIQGMAIQSNGNIYMTTVSPDASIWHATGANTDSPTISRVHKFDNLDAVTGITETHPGVFTFLGGNETSIGVAVMDTFRVYELDTRSSEPVITERIHIPGAGLLASIIPVSKEGKVALVSDSTLGQVYRINVATGEYEIVFKHASMDPPAWGPVPAGLTNMQLHKGYLYFVNSLKALLYRIKFTHDGYAVPSAKVELIIELQAIFFDGFVIGPGGEETIWIATDADNRLLAVTLDGSITVVSGAPDQLTVAGVVTGVFGTLAGDERTFYCITNGGMNVPINGTMIEGGKLAAVDTSSFREKAAVLDLQVHSWDKDIQGSSIQGLFELALRPAQDMIRGFMGIIGW